MIPFNEKRWYAVGWLENARTPTTEIFAIRKASLGEIVEFIYYDSYCFPPSGKGEMMGYYFICALDNPPDTKVLVEHLSSLKNFVVNARRGDLLTRPEEDAFYGSFGSFEAPIVPIGSPFGSIPRRNSISLGLKWRDEVKAFNLKKEEPDVLLPH